MKCPPLRFGHIQQKNYFNFGVLKRLRLRSLFRTPFLRVGQCSKAVRHSPDGLAALIGKDRSGDGNCYFARPSFFSWFHARMTCTLVTRLCGQEYPRPCQPAMLCLYSVYHNLSALDGFGHESPRKCAETTRCTTRTRKNRKPPGLRLPDGFLLYRNYGNDIFSECFSAPALYHPWRKKESRFARILQKWLEMPFTGRNCGRKRPPTQKRGLPHSAVRQSPVWGSLRFTCPPAAPPARLSGRADGSPPRQRSRPRAARTGRWRSPRPGGRADSAAPARPAWRFPADGR